MKTLILIFTLGTLVSCSSTTKVKTFKEAIAENDTLESGIYNRPNGENVQVTVQSLKARIEELEKEKLDAIKEANYYKRTNDELKYENMTLRVRSNMELEKQPKVTGFDKDSNPITEKAE
jgi:hypothetical protein